MVETPIVGVVYAAKSTEDVRGSLPDQIADCRRAIESEPARRVAGEYSDEAFSAYRANRGPGLISAMDHAEELACEHGTAELWVQHSDRLARGDGRSARHAVELALWALKHDVQIRTVQDPDTFRDLLYAVVTGQRNHEDSRRRSLSATAGRRRAAARGDYLGYRSDGYRVAVDVSDDGSIRKHLVIDPARRPAIEKVFRMALQGRSAAAIAIAMNNAGWRTNPSKGKRPREWRPEQVLAILKNPRYAGLSAWKGEILATNAWPRYISERQHHRLQARLAREQKETAPARRHTYLLTALASCGRCGSSLHAATMKARSDGSMPRRYICSRHKWRYGKACEQMPIDADLIEPMFVASLPELLAREENNSTIDLAACRQRIVDAVSTGDNDLLDAALDEFARRSQGPARSQSDEDVLQALAGWAEAATNCSEPDRAADTRRLNQRLRRILASLAVESDTESVTFEARRVSPLGTSHPTTVRVDLLAYVQERSLPRRRGQAWSDAAILHALKEWAARHDRPPVWSDWRPGSPDHPDPVTVRKHFGSWSKAVRRAGLRPSKLEHPSRNWAWTDAEILTCLRVWADTHGRPPGWGDWLKAAPGRPCLNTVAEHFGSWRAGLAAAGL